MRTAARILQRGVEALAARGIATRELRVHLGPAICGDCYEVSPDVYAQLTGRTPARAMPIDLRALQAQHEPEVATALIDRLNRANDPSLHHRQ